MLRKQRDELVEQQKEGAKLIAQLDRAIAKFDGRAVEAPTAENGKPKRFRVTEEQVAAAAEKVGERFKSEWKKSEIGRKDILGALGDEWKTHIPKVIAAWNKTHSSEKIVHNGEAKAKSRYVMK